MGQTNFKNGVALFALATLGSLGMVQTAHADPTTKWNGGPETREDDRRFHVSGRVQYDVESVTDDRGANSTHGSDAQTAWGSGNYLRSGIRRAFLGVDGRLSEHWRYNVKYELDIGSGGNNSANALKADDFYLEYADNWGSIFVGQSNAVSPMEDRDSSLNIPFNERSMIIQALGYGKRPGIAFLTNGGNWSAGVALQSTDALDKTDATATNEGFQTIGRATFAPIFQQTPEGTTVLHLGASIRFRDNGGDGGFTYGVRAAGDGFGLGAGPSSGAGSTIKADADRVISAGGSSGHVLDQDVTYGFETAFQWNAFGAEAEYLHATTNDSIGGTTTAHPKGGAEADGYYVDLFWSPTGESRNYKAADGSFNAVTPLRPMGSGGIGHILLSARYEDADFSDRSFTSTISAPTGSPANYSYLGDATAYTLGVTWVPIEHVKFQLNYSDTSVDPINTGSTVGSAQPASYDVKVVALRTQFDW